MVKKRKTFRIMGKNVDVGVTEEIDACEERSEAERLLAEYGMAFGGAYVLWISEWRDDAKECA